MTNNIKVAKPRDLIHYFIHMSVVMKFFVLHSVQMINGLLLQVEIIMYIYGSLLKMVAGTR